MRTNDDFCRRIVIADIRKEEQRQEAAITAMHVDPVHSTRLRHKCLSSRRTPDANDPGLFRRRGPTQLSGVRGVAAEPHAGPAKSHTVLRASRVWTALCEATAWCDICSTRRGPDVSVWLMNGATVKQAPVVSPGVPLTWQIQ